LGIKGNKRRGINWTFNQNCIASLRAYPGLAKRKLYLGDALSLAYASPVVDARPHKSMAQCANL
jgi:hypothetical protein